MIEELQFHQLSNQVDANFKDGSLVDVGLRYL